MQQLLKLLLLLLFAVFTYAEGNDNIEKALTEEKKKNDKRMGKFFQLFNVVQFPNTFCSSQQSRSSTTASLTNTGIMTNRAGTCFTADECAAKGGQTSGACAAGFGMCCVFTSNGGTVSQNCTYLQNPGFPSSLSSTSAIQYTLTKCSNAVCSVRLDFDTFMTLGPTGTVEANGGQCQDTLTFTTSSRANYPVICGSNGGQHVYLEFGQNSGDTATLNFAFLNSAAGANRIYDIKVTQILCGTNDPPDGCFQYFTTTTGLIQTFNFANAASTHLANQQYTACIRQAEGFCCIQYQVCPGVANAFSLNQFSLMQLGLIDTQCQMDFVQIPGASASCASSNVPQTSRICGNIFTTNNKLIKGVGSQNIAICDCSQPFDVTIVTNSMPDARSATFLSRGVCLEYMQLPCMTTT